ncbi:MAG: hypothetical protein FWH15_03460 [Betaproteobacteria bacterium]|nr:hypothetical protein [Betaproteobacteria bacterium]
MITFKTLEKLSEVDVLLKSGSLDAAHQRFQEAGELLIQMIMAYTESSAKSAVLKHWNGFCLTLENLIRLYATATKTVREEALNAACEEFDFQFQAMKERLRRRLVIYPAFCAILWRILEAYEDESNCKGGQFPELEKEILHMREENPDLDFKQAEVIGLARGFQ